MINGKIEYTVNTICMSMYNLRLWLISLNGFRILTGSAIDPDTDHFYIHYKLGDLPCEK